MPTNALSPRAEPSVVGSRAALAVMLGIGLLAIVNLGGALWIVVAPHSFFDQLGPFGAYNRHYLGDAAPARSPLRSAVPACTRSTTGSTPVRLTPARAPASRTRCPSPPSRCSPARCCTR
jgi:hypothetical protein